jgi:large subunit ribosomal protein L24
MAKFHVKKGDKVVVLSGEHKGKEGVVLEMLPNKSKAIVEGVNVVKKHKKPSATDPQGGIEETEAPIYLSKLMLVDPSTGEPTRIGRKLDENGKLVRYSKKTQEIIK